VRKKKLEVNVTHSMKEKGDKAHIRDVVRKAKKAGGCVWGKGERKWGRDFGSKMMIESVRGRDLGMEETRRGSEGRIQEK
jgi:hypothetical protein